MKKEVKKDEILLNRMYVGSYLSSEFDNIGHEIINLYQAANGKFYIYVLPYGTISNVHNNRIKAILLTRNCGGGIWEILAKAEGLTQISYAKGSKEENNKRIHKEQVKYIDDNNITYGGVKVYDIFAKNIGNEKAIYFTFEAEKIVKPKNPIYITDQDVVIGNGSDYSFSYLDDLNFARQSQKMYVSEDKNPKAYKKLDWYLNDANTWEKEPVQKFKVSDIKDTSNLIGIMGKEYDELAFSNMFKHFFSADKNIFKKFAKDVLEIKNFDTEYTIEREYKNIDLLINDKNNVITIENKIKSGINGCKHNINSEIISDQLCKYYKYVTESKDFSKKEKHFYLFLPDYNRDVDFNLGLKFDGNRGNWTAIRYSQIYNFFKKNPIDTPYFDEFLNALEKHSNNFDNNMEKEMYKKLNQTIKAKAKIK